MQELINALESQLEYARAHTSTDFGQGYQMALQHALTLAKSYHALETIKASRIASEALQKAC